MNREDRKNQITKYIEDKASAFSKNSGNTRQADIQDVVEWIVDYMGIEIMGEVLSETREMEKENLTTMKKLWLDAYVAGSSNYSTPQQARDGADAAVNAFDEMFNQKT